MYKRDNRPTDMTSAIPHVSIFIEDDGVENGSRVILKRIRPHWDLDKIRYKLFTDGITNKLIGLFNDSCPEDDGVLVRVYGKNTDLIIDRSTEFENFKLLYHAGYAPEIYATFDNGMVYKYIRGETLTTTTVREPSVYKLVAKAMARFHKLDVSGRQCSSESGLWAKMEKFADLIPERLSTPSADLRFRKTFARGAGGLRAEIDGLRASLRDVGSPVVFSHNDLLLNNIVLQRDAAAGNRPVHVAFIDYEYAMLNYQAFDIANHFNEFAGVAEPDFSLYPNVGLQTDWLTAYLEEYLDEPLEDRTDRRVAVLNGQVDRFAMVSHLLWSLWSIVQTELSEIDFDYIRYGELRFEQYAKAKKRLDTLSKTARDDVQM